MDILDDNIKIDKDKVKKIRKRIYTREFLNLTKADKDKRKDKEMVDQVKKIVKEIVDECY